MEHDSKTRICTHTRTRITDECRVPDTEATLVYNHRGIAFAEVVLWCTPVGEVLEMLDNCRRRRKT